jgi:hypothetical protein
MDTLETYQESMGRRWRSAWLGSPAGGCWWGTGDAGEVRRGRVLVDSEARWTAQAAELRWAARGGSSAGGRRRSSRGRRWATAGGGAPSGGSGRTSSGGSTQGGRRRRRRAREPDGIGRFSGKKCEKKKRKKKKKKVKKNENKVVWMTCGPVYVRIGCADVSGVSRPTQT